MTAWIWLDASYDCDEAARLCRTEPHVIRWALVDGRIKARPDGRIGGLALFIWLKYQRFNGLNGEVE